MNEGCYNKIVMPPRNRVIYQQKVVKTPQRRRRWRWKRWLFGFLSLAIIGGFLYAANTSRLRIHAIAIQGNSLLTTDELERALRQSISGRRWGVFANDNFFLIFPNQSERALREHFPLIASVEMQKIFPDALVVSIRERTPWGIVCQDVSGGAPQSCAYVDQSGAAYETISNFSGWLLPVIYIASFPPTGPTIEPQLLSAYSQSAEQLKTIQIQLQSMSVGTSTPGDVRLRLEEGWDLLVSVHQPVGEWVGVLGAILEREIGEQRKNLEYIDLRFGKKVFYRFRGSTGSQ